MKAALGVRRSQDELGRKAFEEGERRIIRDMAKMIERGVMDATRINDDGLDDAGRQVIEDERRRRVALDLRKNRRDMPSWADLGQKIVAESRRRDALRDQPKHNLNIGIVQVVVQAPEYPTIMLDEKKE